MYCQLGRTRPLVGAREDYYPPQEIVDEVAIALERHPAGMIDWITFVGSGEPLLHASLGSMIRQVKRLTDLPVAVITNGALLSRPDVREELHAADAVLPSVDAGNPALHRRINRHHRCLSFDCHVGGLSAFRRGYSGSLWVEVMLVEGLNDGAEELREIAEALHRIAPDQVHINVPARAPAEPWVRQPTEDAVARAVGILGDVARAIRPAAGRFDLGELDDVVDAVFAVVSRHPMRDDELRRALEEWRGLDVAAALAELESSGRIQPVERCGVRFWCSSLAHHPAGKKQSGR